MEELQNDIVIYNPSEDINLEVRVAEDTVWLTRQQIAIFLPRVFIFLFTLQRKALLKHYGKERSP